MIGIINVYKEKNMTSFDVVAKLRKILKIKKIGHTGTLDPNATGVLPICIGDATKLVQYILNEDKEYFVTIKLGIKTDSADITGRVIEEKQVPNLNLTDIKECILTFLGKQKQIPPMHSAIKVNGKKLYELARVGIEIERKPREIEIYDIRDIKYDNNEHIITFLVSCSKGTYIRSLSEDICQKLNTVGTLLNLERTKTGVFTKDNSYTISCIEEYINCNSIDKILYNIEQIFSENEKIYLEENKINHFINGVQLTQNKLDGIYTIYVNNKFIGLGEIKNNLLKRKFVTEYK